VDLHLWLWPQCAVLFVFGVVSAEHRWLAPVPDQLRRGCGIAAIAAVMLVAPMMVVVGGDESTFKGGLHIQAFFIDSFEGVFAVAMSIWCLAFFQRRQDRDRRLAAWSAPRAYRAFVAQGLVLVMIALALYPLSTPAGLKFVVLAAGGVIGSFILGGATRALKRSP
jgi:hypothetical protein